MIPLEGFTRMIKHYDDILITCHEDPDGDALGSANALGLLLEQLGKNVLFILPETVPRKYQFLPTPKCQIVDDQSQYQGDVLITVDSSKRDRFTRVDQLSHYGVLVNIDHHPTNSHYGHENIVSPESSSTCELLYDIFHDLGYELNQEIAINLYTGISADTGSFNFENVTKHTFQVAGDLLSWGAEPHQIARELYESVPLNIFHFRQELLNNLQLTDDQRIAWITCKQKQLEKYWVPENELEGIINHAKSLEPVEFAVIFKETVQGQTKVGFRSKTLDVTKIALAYEGGGHKRASGCLVEKPIEQAVEEIIHQLQRELK